MDSAGNPNSVYALSMKLLDDGRIAVLGNCFRRHPRVAAAVLTAEELCSGAEKLL